MTFQNPFGQPLLTFPELDKSPLSIRAKALVFIDPRSQRLRDELELLAPQPLPVLIRGETGTGKELLARQIHRTSDRSGLFVSVNCAAISPTYADAELFGYSAGSHGGTASSRAGWFGSANGGTLYLDEIADLPLAIQGKLLAALENRGDACWGATQPVDVRLVAASSIDLARWCVPVASTSGSTTTCMKRALELPPCASGQAISCRWPSISWVSTVPGCSAGAPGERGRAAVLETHPWPGNTRELENVIHFALLVNDSDELLPHDLDLPRPLASHGS